MTGWGTAFTLALLDAGPGDPAAVLSHFADVMAQVTAPGVPPTAGEIATTITNSGSGTSPAHAEDHEFTRTGQHSAGAN